jgi:hypothetical protein
MAKSGGEMPLYCDIRKYGVENFSFEIIELCDKDSLDKKEREYIIQYQSLVSQNGYNIDEGGQKGRNYHPESDGMAKLNWDMVHQIKQQLIIGTPKRELAEQFGVSVYAIDDINRGKSWKEDDLIYPIYSFQKHKSNNPIV